MDPAHPAKVAHVGKAVPVGKHIHPGPVRLKPISVPVFELPEYLCVETKWVTRKYAMENGFSLDGLHGPITNGITTEVPKKSTQQEKLSEVTGILTSEEPAPSRERAIQTEDKGTKDVGIQCRRDSEEWHLPDDRPKDTTSEASDSDDFLTYVSENTSMFPNGMLECIMCGDIANTLLEHQAHMTVHFGSGALCFNCGHRLEHKNLLKRHRLSCPALAPRKSSMRFKCPHPLCNAMSHSEMQLLQHLKKHSARKCYRCLQCKRYFNTTTSFLLHQKIEQNCTKAKAVALLKRHNRLPKGRGDPRRCSVCLKRFSSERVCLRHRRQCILDHCRRLSKVLLKDL
uniref:GG12086 n=2 Tax=Drosophila erecta TaxID=7220 RepID=B3P5W3_DROER